MGNENSEQSAVERVQLRGTRCLHCDAHYYPPQSFCSACGRADALETTPLGATGTLYTFTTIHVAPRELGIPVPYHVGYVDLDAPRNVRLFGRFTAVDEVPRIDARVEIVSSDGDRDPETLAESYRFRMIHEANDA